MIFHLTLMHLRQLKKNELVFRRYQLEAGEE